MDSSVFVCFCVVSLLCRSVECQILGSAPEARYSFVEVCFPLNPGFYLTVDGWWKWGPSALKTSSRKLKYGWSPLLLFKHIHKSPTCNMRKA